MTRYKWVFCVFCCLLVSPVASASGGVGISDVPLALATPGTRADQVVPPAPELAAVRPRPAQPPKSKNPRSTISLFVATEGYVGLNIRARPTTEAPVLLAAPYRARLTARAAPVRGGDGRNWYRVRYGDTTGYALGSLLSPRIPPQIAPKPAPENWLLGPMSHDYQRLNNCAPTATMMALSYYGFNYSQSDVADALRPSSWDVSVGATEVVEYARGHGLRAEFRLGGTPELMRRLIANDVPVVGLHLLNTWEDIGHFSILRGYDRSSGTFIVNDSNNGPMQYVPVTDYLRLWEPYERSYIVLYRPWQEPVVRAILGRDWDERGNARRYAREQVASARTDPSAEAWMSAGYGLYLAGEHDQAIRAYRTAREHGLSERTLWYTAWPAAALNNLGRHTEALLLTEAALVQTPASSEMLLEHGRAMLGVGRRSEAREAFRLAVEYAPYLTPARVALQQVR